MSTFGGNTFFYLEDGQRLGSAIGILPLPLFKGMEITIHGHEGAFEVADWNYHHGHEDEDAGLRIILRPKGVAGEFSVTEFRV